MVDAVTRLVAEVERELPPVFWLYRRSVLREIEDGLRDAQEDHMAAGARADGAAERAAADFGDPALVAAEFAVEAGATAVRRLAAAQSVLVVLSVVAWAAIGARSSGAAPVSHDELAIVHAVFLVAAAPAVLVGLLAHRRVARHLVSTRRVQRWGLGTAASATLTLIATHGTSMLKARVTELPPEPGDAGLAMTSNLLGLMLLAWSVYVVVAMVQLRRLATVTGEVSVAR